MAIEGEEDKWVKIRLSPPESYEDINLEGHTINRNDGYAIYKKINNNFVGCLKTVFLSLCCILGSCVFFYLCVRPPVISDLISLSFYSYIKDEYT